MTQSREDVIQQDVQDLHKLGYAQELFRTMGGFSNFAISFSIISILTGAVILYDYGLAWAGTAAAMLGWPLITIFVLLIAASMAEIASAYPTAGGLYYWASKMKNKAWGWWTAWFNLIGQFAIVAGINWAAANFLNVTLITPILANFGIAYDNTTVVFAMGETAILTGALVTMGVLMLVELILNIVGINVVAILNQVSVWWHIVVVLLIVVFLLLLGQPNASGLTLFAIQPQDTAGVWDNTFPPAGWPGADTPIFSVSYGPAVSYPIVLAFFFSLLQAELDLHRVRRLGACRRGDRRRPCRLRLGRLPVRGGLSRLRLHHAHRDVPAPAGPLDPLPGRAHGRRDLQSVLLRWRLCRHLHPRVQPQQHHHHQLAAG